MAVPNQITDIFTTAASNSPLGTDAIGTTLDDYLRAIQAIVAQEMEKIKPKYTVGGTANAITLTPANVSYPTAYAAGDIYSFKATAANTGAATVNINGLGAKSIFQQSAAGVVALAGGEIQSGQAVTLVYDGTQFQILSFPSAMAGTTTNNSASAGNIGEYISQSASGVSLTNNTCANITSISLTAGDWDVSGVAVLNLAGTTSATDFVGAINTTSATLPSPPNSGGYATFAGSILTGANPAVALAVGPMRFSLSATTTIYLVTQASFATSTATASGFLRARRVR